MLGRVWRGGRRGSRLYLCISGEKKGKGIDEDVRSIQHYVWEPLTC